MTASYAVGRSEQYNGKPDCGTAVYLEGQDPDKDISLYINSPGGSITAGMAIYDTMNYIKCDVSTICIGMAASMGAFFWLPVQRESAWRCPTAKL